MGRTRKRIAGDAAQQGYTSPCRNEIGKSVFHRPTHAEAFSPAIPKAQAVYAPSYGACLGVSPSAEESGVDDSWLQLCVDGTGETFNRFGAYLQQQGYALTDTRYEGNSMIATVARGETHFQVEYDWVELFLVVEYPNVVMPERQRDATGSTGFVWNGITADAGAASATEAPVSATRQDWHSISSGTWHTVAVRADGTMVAAGDNAKGQCNVSGWKNIVSVSAGARFTMGLQSDGAVVATGSNCQGQCGVNGWKNAVAVSAGDSAPESPPGRRPAADLPGDAAAH